jgi:uncharacterized membrane protein YhhN
MFYACIPAYFCIIFTIIYLIARNRDDLKYTSIIQPILTLLAIITASMAFLSPAGEWDYTIWILFGLGVCLIADVFHLDVVKKKTHSTDIIIYVSACLIFALIFTYFNGFQPQDWIFSGIFLVIYGLLVRMYWENLGRYKIPVMLYGLLMPFMVTRAISTFFGDSFSIVAAILITLGSILLFLGDVEYCVNRFHQPIKFFYGPICHAGGLLLIALSCSYFNI